MIEYEIRDLTIVKGRSPLCKAKFTVLILCNGEPQVRIHNCTLLYGEKTKTYFVGFPCYKRGSAFEAIVQVLSEEAKSKIQEQASQIYEATASREDTLCPFH